MNWATVPAEEVMQRGVRVGEALGGLTRNRYTAWLYMGHLVVVHHESDWDHIVAVFDRDDRPVWFHDMTEAGWAILTAAGVK